MVFGPPADSRPCAGRDPQRVCWPVRVGDPRRVVPGSRPRSRSADRVRPGRAAVAHAALAYPAGRLDSRLGLGRRGLRLRRGGGWSWACAPPCSLTPGRQGCGLCPANLLLVHSEPGLVGQPPPGRPYTWAGLGSCPGRRRGGSHDNGQPAAAASWPWPSGLGLSLPADRFHRRRLTPRSSVRRDGGKTPAVVDANTGTATQRRRGSPRPGSGSAGGGGQVKMLTRRWLAAAAAVAVAASAGLAASPRPMARPGSTSIAP